MLFLTDLLATPGAHVCTDNACVFCISSHVLFNLPSDRNRKNIIYRENAFTYLLYHYYIYVYIIHREKRLM